MAATIRPLKRRRRTAQRGKPMSQAQRWGKVVTIMPVPQGQITTTQTWKTPAEPVVEEVVEETVAEKPAPKKRAKKV